MKALLTLKKGGTVSLVHDAEALGCFLFDILAFFEKPNTQITIGEINRFARDLGYKGSISAIRRVLLEKNFLTEVERGARFSLSVVNKAAINEFCKSQPPSFHGLKFTDKEYAGLFGSSGIQGTVGEAFLARVMGQLAALNTTLSGVYRLEIKAVSDVAEHIAGNMFLRERVRWYLGKMNHLCVEFDATELVFGRGSDELKSVSKRYIETHARMSKVVDAAEEENVRYEAALRDIAIFQMLKEVRLLLLQITASFSKKEREI